MFIFVFGMDTYFLKKENTHMSVQIAFRIAFLTFFNRIDVDVDLHVI